MKSVFKILPFFLITFVFKSCNTISNKPDQISKTSLIESTSWLIGDWVNKESEGKTIESWKKLNDTVLVGKSFFINEDDSVLLENLLIIQKQESLFYIPTVLNQNDGKPVEFKLSQFNDRKLTFENKQHDFPQKISYSKISNNSILAEISGKSNGVEKSVKFPMTRN